MMRVTCYDVCVSGMERDGEERKFLRVSPVYVCRLDWFFLVTALVPLVSQPFHHRPTLYL